MDDEERKSVLKKLLHKKGIGVEGKKLKKTVLEKYWEVAQTKDGWQDGNWQDLDDIEEYPEKDDVRPAKTSQAQDTVTAPKEHKDGAWNPAILDILHQTMENMKWESNGEAPVSPSKKEKANLSQSKGKEKEAEKPKESEKPKHAEKPKEKPKQVEKSKEPEKSKEKPREPEKSKEKSKDPEKSKEKSKEPEKSKEKSKEPEKPKEKSKEPEKSKEKSKEPEKSKAKHSETKTPRDSSSDEDSDDLGKKKKQKEITDNLNSIPKIRSEFQKFQFDFEVSDDNAEDEMLPEQLNSALQQLKSQEKPSLPRRKINGVRFFRINDDGNEIKKRKRPSKPFPSDEIATAKPAVENSHHSSEHDQKKRKVHGDSNSVSSPVHDRHKKALEEIEEVPYHPIAIQRIIERHLVNNKIYYLAEMRTGHFEKLSFKELAELGGLDYMVSFEISQFQ